MQTKVHLELEAQDVKALLLLNTTLLAEILKSIATAQRNGETVSDDLKHEAMRFSNMGLTMLKAYKSFKTEQVDTLEDWFNIPSDIASDSDDEEEIHGQSLPDQPATNNHEESGN